MPPSAPSEIVDLNIGTVQVLETDRTYITQNYYEEAIRQEAFGYHYAFRDFVRDALLAYSRTREQART